MSQYGLEPQPPRKGRAPYLMPIALVIVGIGLILNALVSFTATPPAPIAPIAPTSEVALAAIAPATATPWPMATPLPAATWTPEPPTATWTPAPPTPTWTPEPPTRTPVPTATEPPTRTPTPLPTATPTPDPLAFTTICEPRGSEMTAPQRERYVAQFRGQFITNWEGWVYDVNEVGSFSDYADRGRWSVAVAMEPRGIFFWSRQIVIYGIPDALAEGLSVEQPIRFSGRIADLEIFLEGICNPVVIVDAVVTPR